MLKNNLKIIIAISFAVISMSPFFASALSEPVLNNNRLPSNITSHSVVINEAVDPNGTYVIAGVAMSPASRFPGGVSPEDCSDWINWIYKKAYPADGPPATFHDNDEVYYSIPFGGLAPNTVYVYCPWLAASFGSKSSQNPASFTTLHEPIAPPANGYVPCTNVNDSAGNNGEVGAFEGMYCTVPDATGYYDAAYGANGNYKYKTYFNDGISDGFLCSKDTFGGDPAPGVFKECFVRPATNYPDYTYCAKQGGTCTVSSKSLVIFGFGNNWKFKKGVTGTIACNSTEFNGDPMPNKTKACFSLPQGPDGFAFCSKKGTNCETEDIATMAFGANDTFTYKPDQTGSQMCDTPNFTTPAGVSPNILNCFIKSAFADPTVSYPNLVDPNSHYHTVATRDDLLSDLKDTSVTIYGSATPNKISTSGYFRYSKQSIPPVFCNDIYGADMKSTTESPLGNGVGIKIFKKTITDLDADTQYYYCAIASEKTRIEYGGVGTFTTKPDPLSLNALISVETKSAFVAGKSSAYLNGHYNAIIPNETYFEYKKKTSYDENLNNLLHPMTALAKWALNPTQTNLTLSGNQTKTANINNITQSTPSTISIGAKQLPAEKSTYVGIVSASSTDLSKSNGWTKVGSTTHAAGGSGDINFLVTGLTPNTDYQFRAVIKSINGAEKIKNGETEKINPGNTFDFKTLDADQVVDGDLFAGLTQGEYTHQNKTVPTAAPETPVAPHALGDISTAPVDAVVHLAEGVETVFARQIIKNLDLMEMYGYQEGQDANTFSWHLADILGKEFGYVNSKGIQVRVSKPDVNAYELQMKNGVITVYEYYNSKIIDVRTIYSGFKNKLFYEYYYKK